MKIDVTLNGLAIGEFDKGITPIEIAAGLEDKEVSIKALAVDINGVLCDLNTPLEEKSDLVFHSFDTEKGKEVYWHSTAHILAEAVKELFPEVKVTIGPAIEEGFYYDFDKDVPFTEEELSMIEVKMNELVKSRLPFVREETTKAKAKKLFEKIGESYKIEILNELPKGEKISTYTHGSFTDLCRGPHIPHSGKIKAIKVLKTSGAYWRGDETNKMLARIYGISFPSKKELKTYLLNLEEKKKRDHRRIGKELDLFSINDTIGPGLVLWHPNGALIRHLIEDYWKKRHFEAGYQVVNTPHIGKAELWETSGHLGFYAESMFAPIEVEGQLYYLKPMNCPFHIAIYNSDKHSYRDLPIKYAEMGTVYRYERSGVLHGLMRVRGFTQDDAHIICTPDDLMIEVKKLLEFSLSMLRKFGFEQLDIYLATKPDKCVGCEELWTEASDSLSNALNEAGLDYKIDEKGGAFYGPKIDIKIKDALGRSWQCTTIQFDFNLPERFKMEYVGADNKPHRPYMIHRALLGSLERFFGTLIEYHGGDFPFWLKPVQAVVIAVSENYTHYAARIQDRLKQHGVRAELDARNEKIGYKIREAEMKKIPYMLIIGQREEDNNTVSLRKRKEGDIGSLGIEEVLKIFDGERDK